jgi:hypothetical protein
MLRLSRWLFLAVLVLALPTLIAACAKKTEEYSSTTPPAAAVTVTDVDLGRAVGSDNRVVDKVETFAPKDVIYATVITKGASPSSIIKATWTFEDGQVVDTSERTIAPTGEAATEFHIAKPDGFPAGKYKVEVYLDGSQVSTKTFEVKAG